MQQTIDTCFFANSIETDHLFLLQSIWREILNIEYTPICDAGKDIENCEICNLWTEKDPTPYKDLIKKQPPFEFIPEQDSTELNFG